MTSQYDPNRLDTKNFDSNKRKIGQIFDFVYAELVHDENLSDREFKEILRDNLNQALDIYESMKPYVLYNRLAFEVTGMEWTFNDAIFEVSEMWLSCLPDGYTENEVDQRIDHFILQTIEWQGLDVDVHFHNVKAKR